MKLAIVSVPSKPNNKTWWHCLLLIFSVQETDWMRGNWSAYFVGAIVMFPVPQKKACHIFLFSRKKNLMRISLYIFLPYCAHIWKQRAIIVHIFRFSIVSIFDKVGWGIIEDELYTEGLCNALMTCKLTTCYWNDPYR